MAIPARSTRYAANAAVSILEMLAAGKVEVSGKVMAVKSFEQAKQIKVGKLFRVVGHIKMAGAQKFARLPKRYEENIKVWERVARQINALPNMKSCKALAQKA